MTRICVNWLAPKHAVTQPLQYETHISLMISRRFAVWLAGDLLYLSIHLKLSRLEMPLVILWDYADTYMFNFHGVIVCAETLLPPTCINQSINTCIFYLLSIINQSKINQPKLQNHQIYNLLLHDVRYGTPILVRTHELCTHFSSI